MEGREFRPRGPYGFVRQSGAKYFYAQATHHDNFFNYDSKVHPYNSMRMDPHNDIVAMWRQAARKRGLRFGISEHLGASFEWLNTNKGHDEKGPYVDVPYDGVDKAHAALYLDNAEYLDLTKQRMHYTLDKRWPPIWYERVKEMVDTLRPDMLYSDGAVPFYRRNATTLDPTYESGPCMVSHLYNSSAKENDGVNQAIYFQKDSRKEFYDIGLLDIERSLAPKIKAVPWQTDTCLGHWFYDVRAEYKTYNQMISLFVDIISKNGNLLLNIPQRPDGTIDDECKFVLDKLGEWFAVCGEAVYGTRTYSVFGEGPTGVPTENRAEGKGMVWTSYDFRYTRKGNMVYAFVMGRPETAALHKFAEVDSVKRVRLLGVGELPFARATWGF